MSLRYLFPCSKCEHKFELVSKQAGQDLVCPSCGATGQAPKLGTLKQLERVGQESDSQLPAQQTQNSSSGSWKNVLFVSGLALAILAGAAGFALYNYAQSKVVVFDVEGRLEQVEKWIDEQPPTGILGTYVNMDVSQGLPEWVEQPHVGSNKQAAILKNFAYGLFGLASLGLLTLLGSFLMPK